MRIKDTMEIEGPHGETLAKVKKAIFTPVRDRWTVKIGGGPDLDVQGNILDHEYRIEEGRTKIGKSPKSGSVCAIPTVRRSPRARTTC